MRGDEMTWYVHERRYPSSVEYLGCEILRGEDPVRFSPYWFVVDHEHGGQVLGRFSTFEDARLCLAQHVTRAPGFIDYVDRVCPANPDVEVTIAKKAPQVEVIVAQEPECICSGTGWADAGEFEEKIPCPRCNPFLTIEPARLLPS